MTEIRNRVTNRVVFLVLLFIWLYLFGLYKYNTLVTNLNRIKLSLFSKSILNNKYLLQTHSLTKIFHLHQPLYIVSILKKLLVVSSNTCHCKRYITYSHITKGIKSNWTYTIWTYIIIFSYECTDWFAATTIVPLLNPESPYKLPLQ